MDSVGLDQNRDKWRTRVSLVMNLRVVYHAGNYMTSCKTVGISRSILLHGVSKLTRFIHNCNKTTQKNMVSLKIRFHFMSVKFYVKIFGIYISIYLYINKKSFNVSFSRLYESHEQAIPGHT